MRYRDFLEQKKFTVKPSGIDVENIHPLLFDFQRDLVRWALKKGKAALFTMTGTGKTLMQCEWARHVSKFGDVLILAPLAVSRQTVKEARKISMDITLCRSQQDVKPGVNITNCEMLHKFEPEKFAGIVLDESSILKSYDGKTRTQIIDSFIATPFKLACTATPAPNDFMELGNHAEFLGVMSRAEMLAMFFVHDSGDTQKWRLKGHAESKFWEWVASWASVLSRPSDLGYDDGAFNLPPLRVHEIVVPAEEPIEGMLFAVEATTLQERQSARRTSTERRVEKCAELVNGSDKPFLVWCGLNAESEALKKSINGAVEVKGSDSSEHKETALMGFSEGDISTLVTKPSIAGFGLNWQHCNQMAFVGLSDSFEQYFQAVRRCWRFGQTEPVDVYVIIAETEGAVVKNIKRKEEDAQKMLDAMVAHTKEITKKNIKSTTKDVTEYEAGEPMEIPIWLGGERIAS